MSLVMLGKLVLRWCRECNLPVLEDERCGRCGGATYEVKLTPPGDVRPAFAKDLDTIRSVIDKQFGKGTGEAVLPDSEIFILNKIPAIDRMEEVIGEGEVIGTLRYDLGRGYRFLSRMPAARRMQGRMSRGFVRAEEGAVPFILQGLNLMAPGVADVHEEVVAGDEVVVIDPQSRAICTGTARMSASALAIEKKGLAVKARWQAEPQSSHDARTPTSWNDAIEANKQAMSRRVDEAVTFIHRTIEKYDLPTMVSFSGGKDSLATLLLTLDAKLDLPVFFVNTGLEFPETVEHVRAVAIRHGLGLIEETAPEAAFFGNLDYFGPPGRDFRWCCKTNKLGPTVSAILKHYPEGVLSFIGQRRYESEQRADKPRVWKNPWTPGQIGASPIQDWTALHVWLYIFSKGEAYNVWYDRGLDRIGCYLCPASDVAETQIVLQDFPGSNHYIAYLRNYADKRGLPEAWLRFALHRWRRLPDSVRKELETLGIGPEELRAKATSVSDDSSLRLKMQSGASPCVLGFSIEGAFNRAIDLSRAAELLNQAGEVSLNEEEGWCFVNNVRLFAEGALVAKGKDQQEIRKNVERVRRAVVKAEECVGCGVCIAKCDEGALTLVQGRVHLSKDLCIHCGRCIEPCPALAFGDSAFEM